MAILIFFVAHWYLSLFSQTFFQHRYGAHSAFKMSKGWEKVFFIVTWITEGSSYLSPRAYAIMHRMHHAFTDTEKDPHSPSFSKNLMDMMWKTKNVYTGIFDSHDGIEPRFLKGVPSWPAFDKFAHGWISRIGWAILYTLFYVKFAPYYICYLLLPIHFAMGPVHGAVINWYAHKYGYTNYKMNNTSENLLHIDWLMLGESYHNNHHKFPTRANFGVKWHEVDPIYPIVLVFKTLGIIKMNPAAVNKPKTLVATHEQLELQEF